METTLPEPASQFPTPARRGVRIRAFGLARDVAFQHLVSVHRSRQAEGVSVHIFKSREGSLPIPVLWRKLKANSAIPSFVELGVDIFGYEVDLAVASDEFAHRRVARRQGQREARSAIRRPDLDPPASRLEELIHYKPKTKLVEVESQASFLIANKDHDEM